MKFTSLPIDDLPIWAKLNNIRTHGVAIESRIVDKDGNDKGAGLVATEDLKEGDVLISIPDDLLLSKALVDKTVKFDRHLREVMEIVGPDFAQDSRIAIIIFLIVQLTYAHYNAEGVRIGVTTPLTDYVKFLPKDISLPTFYEQEIDLLQGTSLAIALDQKLIRLQTEFNHFQKSTEKVKWCQDKWWNEVHGILTFEVWKLADALYRSRAFEVPGSSSHCMAPLLDMVNHASRHNAGFQLDDHDNSLLLVCRNALVKTGEEITINYGCGGACETLFSYGFLEKDTHSAREMYMSFDIPNDDPLKRAKLEFAGAAPAIRVFVDDRNQVHWESPLVWWACTNEEDGLNFRVLQKNDGSSELKATWRDNELEASRLQEKLLEETQQDVFSLRATVSVQGRVEMQGTQLSIGQEAFDAGVAAGLRGPVVEAIKRLRDLEMELLATSYGALESEKQRLFNSETVREYLSQRHSSGRANGAEEEEFS